MYTTDLLATLPYDRARAKNAANTLPDAKRLRDGKQVYQTIGLLYVTEGKICVTELGMATRRWLDILTPQNRAVFVRHAAYALAACQLRNPTGSGKKYPSTVEVFPFAFIWRAMLSLDNRISSDELNRGLFKVSHADQLAPCISNIRQARAAQNIELLGAETIHGEKKNDRIIPWMSLASFGWTLFQDKGDLPYYQLDLSTRSIIEEASQIRYRHRDFSFVSDYVEYVSQCAALPRDLR